MAAVAAALGLVLVAVAQGAYALDERNTADFVRSLVLPGTQADTSTFDAATVTAVCEAVVALPIAVSTLAFRARPVFAIAAVWSVLALGTGAWIALETNPRLETIAIGPIELSMVAVGVALALAAGLCLIGSIVGWLASPAEPAVARPHMPPQTHRA